MNAVHRLWQQGFGLAALILLMAAPSLGCPVSISPTSNYFSAGGGNASVSVMAPDDYDWTAVSSDGWITLTSRGRGRGNGTVTYAVAGKRGLGLRVGTLTIAGRVLTIVQDDFNPVPALASLSPDSIDAGVRAFTLTVTGMGFTNDSVVRWNGADRPTTLAGTTQLRTTITFADLATAGTASVTVFNPPPNGGTSNALTFQITDPYGARVEVIPAYPTPADKVSLRLSGIWRNGCVPQTPQVSISGQEIRVSTSNPGQVCTEALTSWSSTVAIGQLPLGSYRVVVTYSSPSAPGGPFEIGQKSFIVANPVVNVSAANYGGTALAGEALAVAFGTSLAAATNEATTYPLPVSLGGTTVRIKDSSKTEYLAPLLFVSRTQVNYQIPAGTVTGAAVVTIISGDGVVSVGTIQIADVAPGLFTANLGGQGLAAALALRVRADGSQQFEPVVRFDAPQNNFLAAPIDLGPESDQVFLILFGTGLRCPSSTSAVSVSIGGVDAEVLYAGPQGIFAGLDQVNVRVPRSLSGRGDVEVRLSMDGKSANTVMVNIK